MCEQDNCFCPMPPAVAPVLATRQAPRASTADKAPTEEAPPCLKGARWALEEVSTPILA